MSKLFRTIISVLIFLFLFELASQGLFYFIVNKQLETLKKHELHYYQQSADPIFTFELKPHYKIEYDNRSLNINTFGFRDNEDSVPNKPKIALIGDSVPFGIGLSQEETPAARLQSLLGDSIKVINYSVPGYGLEELAHLLTEKFSIYRPEKVIYLLNPNDFSRRNTVYEGADNGMYRVYKKPVIKSLFFIQKAYYRYKKDWGMSSVKWCRWMYEGNKNKLEPLIAEMSEFVKKNGGEFSVVLFPTAVGYQENGFALMDVFNSLEDFCKKNDIPVYSPVSEFSKNVYQLQDSTDHFTAKGAEVMAQYIFKHL